MSPSSASNTRLSLVLAPVTSTDSGSPLPSTARCSLDPALARSTGFAPTWSPPDRAQAEGVHAHPRPVQPAGLAQLVQQQLLQPLEHPGVGPFGKAPPAGGRRAATELGDRQQRPGGGGAGHEQDRGHAGPIRYGAGRAPAGVGGRRWQQGLEALPQRLGQEFVGQGGHERGSSHNPPRLNAHHPTRFRNVLLAAWVTASSTAPCTSLPCARSATTPPGVPITAASSANTRRRRRLSETSSGSCPTSCTATSSPTSDRPRPSVPDPRSATTRRRWPANPHVLLGSLA